MASRPWPSKPRWHSRHPNRPPRVRAVTFPLHRRVYLTSLLVVSGFALLRWLTQLARPSTRRFLLGEQGFRFVSLDAEFRLRLPSDFASRIDVAIGSELVPPPPPKDFHLLATAHAGRHAGGGRPPPPDPRRASGDGSCLPPVVGDGQRRAAFGHNSLGPAKPGLPATPHQLALIVNMPFGHWKKRGPHTGACARCAACGWQRGGRHAPSHTRYTAHRSTCRCLTCRPASALYRTSAASRSATVSRRRIARAVPSRTMTTSGRGMPL